MNERLKQALAIMNELAARSRADAQRYLWTDAFAVCNWLGLAQVTGEARYLENALHLVAQVHQVLGRHRPDDLRRGWISGLDHDEAAAHPTQGGLRIGKPLPERRAQEPPDDQREWDRDGQYFHYLTKWMHALDQVTQSTGQPLFNRWACELAIVAHRHFTYVPAAGAAKRMYWKLSIDLSRPQVASMGQHDPIDGLVTYLQLQSTAAADTHALDAAIADFAAMIQPQGLATIDPLGIGGLLFDAFRLGQFAMYTSDKHHLTEVLLDAVRLGLQAYVNQPDLRASADRRLAFRELGLAIGLAALERPEWATASDRVRERVRQLARFVPIRGDIESFWLRPAHRRVRTWVEHANINDVMLATSLEPTGFMAIANQRRQEKHSA